MTEFRAEYTNPSSKRLDGFESYEQNKRGRFAYIPEKDTKGAGGVCKYFSLYTNLEFNCIFWLVPMSYGKPYVPVVPKYTLPQLCKL